MLALTRRLGFTHAVIDGQFVPRTDVLKARGKRQESLHQRAALSTSRRFGSKVFVRGVVEISNDCRENCAYCGMRRENRQLSRYRAELDQLAELLVHNR